jgi:broad specificity phosphatase PhoE
VLVLIRHGQTAANAEGLFLGREDPPLTELGWRQADALRSVASVRDATRVVTSPLRRARDTAGRLGPPVTVDERWIEMDYGDYEGMSGRDVPAEVSAAWQSDLAWAPPGGESLLAVSKRVREACEELADEAATSDLIVVSHVSPIKAAVAWALGVGEETAWRMFLGVASVCRIGFGPRGPVLSSFNETQHLSGV